MARFSLAKLMLLLTILCAVGATLSYLGQGLHSPQTTNMRFVLFSLIAPTVMLLVASLLVSLLAAWKRRTNAKPDQAQEATPSAIDRPRASGATRRFGAVRKSAPDRTDKIQ